MIARIFPETHSFLRVCRYVCQDLSRAVVLDQEGIRGHDYRLMARDFEAIHDLRPGREKPVFHGVIDFHPEEDINDIKMVQIARKYLAEVGMENTQYAIVKHIDRRHLHVHMVASRIDYDGKHIQNYPERLRSKDAVQDLIREYGLIPAGSKNLRQTNWEALDASETRLYKIYRCIMESLPHCQNLPELEARLLKSGIYTQYRYDEQTGKRLGISFRYEQEAFKGSRIDRAFALGRLERTLALRQELTLWEQQKLGLRKEQELVQQQKLVPEKEQTIVKERKQKQKIRGVDEERLTPRHSYRLRIS